jgi:hypothetical protein
LFYLTGVGSKTFIEEMKDALGFRAAGRKILCTDDTFELRETVTPYGKDSDVVSGNTFLWKYPIDRLTSRTSLREPPFESLPSRASGSNDRV